MLSVYTRIILTPARFWHIIRGIEGLTKETQIRFFHLIAHSWWWAELSILGSFGLLLLSLCTWIWVSSVHVRCYSTVLKIKDHNVPIYIALWMCMYETLVKLRYTLMLLILILIYILNYCTIYFLSLTHSILCMYMHSI